MANRLRIVGGRMKIPAKPKTTKAQIDMIWDALFNEIPHKFKWQDVKINFILVFVALILTMIGILVVRG